ncbi:hypothetical protein EKH57_13440 [Halorubrum sp. BOL3-1]|uniref:hypothetical protein n=1 Tax=Halorubrum sp. BOL3-1 TaxID=2497325 RepID=UPI0010052491|nr:hypothetical protein [Halorubrum sp. BOL3-1]QAU13639.1 hypothetical protein EKH57_13440 [Halorubrum sp. BOL3-1]
MRFSRDRRGQSVVVGTVILFGFLIVALGVYQVQVVPTENADVEFEHSQAVEDDFGDLRNDVLRAGSTGSTGSTQVRLGTRYPSRTFFVNPPPVSGSLSTEETGAIRIRNATVGGGARENARRFWNATDPTFETRSIRYDARYNEFRGAPELVYEHSVIAAEFDDAVLLRTGQTVVSDGRISLTALSGSVSESGIERRSVDPRAVSASGTTVPLTPVSGSITLELPTAVENASALATRWNGSLPAGATAAMNATGDAVRITLPNGSDPYRLALSEVSLDNTGNTEPAYVVPVGSQTASVGEPVTVEVRDRYNNPAPDATVGFDGTNETTGDDGRAFFEPTASGPLTAAINGTVGPSYESVTFDVSEGGGVENRTFDVEWDESDPVSIEEGTSESLDILVADAASDQRVDGAAVDVSFAPLGNVSGLPSVPEPPKTGSDGRTTVDMFNTDESSAGDSFTLYAASGDDVDRLVVDVVESTGTYEILSVDPEPAGGNDIDVNFEIDTDDAGAQVNVQSLDDGGAVRDETGLVPVGPQPQTETIKGANQAAEVRVILYDSDGDERDRQTVSYP